MDLDALLKEMNVDQEQRNYALSQAGISTRPSVTIGQVQLDVIKNVLGHVYRPNEYSIGMNGSSFDVSVNDQNFNGPFDKVLKSCVEFVVKPQNRRN
jgi:hypothetical protein